MKKRATPLLHRDDPEKDPLVGHVKVTHEDWLDVARDVLVTDGVAEVKVMSLGARLGVSRSSFSWYFKGHKHLLEALLNDWEERNTKSIVSNCALPAQGITEAVCHFFRCFIDPDLFDQGLDFAVREWARRDGAVRTRIDQADRARLDAVTAMFERHGYDAHQADVRSRILYYMQLGYHALDVREPMADRLSRLDAYLECFTGVSHDRDAVEAHKMFSLSKYQG